MTNDIIIVSTAVLQRVSQPSDYALLDTSASPRSDTDNDRPGVQQRFAS